MVTSYTIKVYPEFSTVTYMDLTISATGNVTEDMFVSGLASHLITSDSAFDI